MNSTTIMISNLLSPFIFDHMQPSLATSKTAYKTLLGGLAHGDFNEYCSTGLLPYEGVKHHDSTANPLHFFDYNSVIERWLTDDEKPPQAPEPVQEDK